MSTPFIVKSLNQVVIKTRPVGVDGLEWGLEIDNDPNKPPTFVSLTDQMNDLTVNFDSSAQEFILTLSPRTAPPTEYAAHGYVETNTIQYDFEADSLGRTRVIVIEDLTAHLQVHNQSPVGQYVMTLFIQSITGSSTSFKHEFWHRIESTNAQA